MTREDFDEFCGGLPHTTHVVQWGAVSVWKIGGKMFALGDREEKLDAFCISFKTTEMSFEILREQPGCRPAPYLASRGAPWIQQLTDETLNDIDLQAYITQSYKIVGSGLPKKTQRDLGFLPEKDSE
ncbi:MmcQ/YjbR family DNA-binding protein [Hyphobacterium sp. HN65]|uniref:MmcQ/YjbR family DNA-binding protein n=1 Tax=Hyphobacterium lacteum TaxID=3116575 RepID=A0ABU7LPY6_9PROT|nr:MmcQ/YjbR family DNA-binding protein [Hyphobacterium sp. HN65]MEE2525962.1 MmcQ/YjbR family DNA-binding protein [Hyphobacterium sp. HN65]